MAAPASEDVRATIHDLEVRRGSRRGTITKLHHRIAKIISDGPERINSATLNDLANQLSTAIDAHTALQSQLDEFYDTYDELRSPAKADDDDNLLDTHVEWRADVHNVIKALPLRRKAASVLNEAESYLDGHVPDSQYFRSLVDKLHGRHVEVSDACAEVFHALPDLKEICDTTAAKMSALLRLTATSCKDTPPTTPTVSAAAMPARTSSSDSNALKIELPSFDGDPFKWANFRTMFTQAIDQRARGHSVLEVKGLLIKAIKHPDGLKILHNLPSDDTPLAEMLDRLETIFGAPDVLSPLIIRKILSVHSCSLSASDFDQLYEQLILPYNKFRALVGDSLGEFLARMVSSFMSTDCRREWIRHRPPDTAPSMSNLSKFVDAQRKELRRANSLSSPSPSVPSSAPLLPSSAHLPPRPSSPRRSANAKPPPPRRTAQHCPVCGELHTLSKCSTFAGYDLDKRNQVVRERRLCLNCFTEGHGCKSCPSRFSCRHCNGRHHSLLHRDREAAATSSKPQPTSMMVAHPVSASTPSNRKAASLYSAIVAFDRGGRTVHARALLDAGAAIPMMTESLATSLNLPRRHDPIPVTGISGTTRCEFIVTCNLYSVDLGFKLAELTFTLIDSLEPIARPADAASIKKLPELRHFKLADDELGGRVDLVLGISQLTTLTSGAPFKVGELGALPTQLGLCLSCPLEAGASPAVNTVSTPGDTPADVARLWELDRVPEAPTVNQEEQAALDHFDLTHRRMGDGRYSVSLPRTTSPPELGDSRPQALSRLLANERSLKSRGRLQNFSGVIQEYFTLGHAEVVPHEDLKKPSYYMPVHAVVKESSTSTKLRAVFDASARTTNGSSLNDQLLPGPNLYPPLPDVLIRFRCHPSAVSADISKMFRGILLNVEEKDWHRFLYRAVDGSIRDARMRRLTFGVKSSPFLATQVLRRHAQDHLDSHPAAAHAVLADFYVDDVLSGARNAEEAHALFMDLRTFCAEAGLDLRKWRTNDPALRQLIPDELLEEDRNVSPSPDSHKALGVHWDTASDSLYVAIPDLPSDFAKVTKRVIAALTAGVFDVLGLFAPVVISARILFQDTWKRGLSWDEEVPDDLQRRWSDWIEDLPRIHQHPIPRYVFSNSAPGSQLTLHGFCDASTVAYGAAIYARSEGPDNSISITLIIAKARVLPTKPITVPKAELCGALLLAKLLRHTTTLLDLPLSAIHAWTDSEIVLYWLPKAPPSLNRFVANRVVTIQDLVPPERWRHVATNDNPADLASRGVRALELLQSELWWHGPGWLSLPPDSWPPPFRTKPTLSINSVSVLPDPSLSPSETAFMSYLANICSSFSRLVRVLCYARRFFNNCCHPTSKIAGPLTLDELSSAKAILFTLAQRQSFPKLFHALSSQSAPPVNHPLRHYHLTMSPHGYILAQSRVRNPNSPSAPTQLIPLSVSSPITKLLLTSAHRSHGHPGTSTLTSILSTTYLIVGLRNFLKQVSRRCVICQKILARPLSHTMGMLPSVRTTPAPPFAHVGIDFAGPLTLRVGYTRKPVHIKAYVTVFVCMATKSVHLEICEKLTSEDFLATFRRFTARRGCPATIHSDNGSNFVGAAEEIRAIQAMTGSREFRDTIINHCSTYDIKWHFIPPRAPHFGGLWEAAVKAMKVGLRKVAAPHPLTWPELETLLTEVESVLNSRPIVAVKAGDLEEGNILTPGHFLIGRPLRATPAPTPPSGKLSLLRRWNLTERLQTDLWKHWLAAYISSCSARAKWLRPGRPLRVGDIVLVKDESLRSRSWPLALVTKLHPGDDNITRVATLYCRGKEYKRPVIRLVPLITDEEEAEAHSFSNSNDDPIDAESAPHTTEPALNTPATLPSAPPGVCLGSTPNQRCQARPARK